ncbi:uncharacterized protein LOC108087765 [Drosophila ficusphila]|uniref:uncharacterized protein LOC108087765 n=1 Tax=Drosophila ficusphila TaxID=30025 RepID=UPI0007E67FE1|nr:uncharacterized protein LOC108087765 [Drosophila ficusphila]
MYSIALVVFFSYLSWKVLCEPSFIYKLKNMECSTVPGFSANASCRIKPVNWNKAVAEMDVDLARTLKNISIRVQFYMRDYSNQYQPFLVDVMINFCNILSKRNFLPYGIMILQVTKRFSNFNHSCPYSGHLMARDAYFDETFAPNLFPLGFYKVNITIMEGYVRAPSAHVGNIVSYVQVMQAYRSKKKSNRTKS